MNNNVYYIFILKFLITFFKLKDFKGTQKSKPSLPDTDSILSLHQSKILLAVSYVLLHKYTMHYRFIEINIKTWHISILIFP